MFDCISLVVYLCGFAVDYGLLACLGYFDVSLVGLRDAVGF